MAARVRPALRFAACVPHSAARALAPAAAETAITFLTELGRLPLLTIDASALSGTVAVDVLAPGSKETVTCSNRGVCGTSV